MNVGSESVSSRRSTGDVSQRCYFKKAPKCCWPLPFYKYSLLVQFFVYTSAVDLSDRDNKETLVIKEEETYDAEAFEKVEVGVVK